MKGIVDPFIVIYIYIYMRVCVLMGTSNNIQFLRGKKGIYELEVSL